MNATTNSPSPSPGPATRSSSPRSVWVAIVSLTAVIIGAGAGLLAYVGGAAVSTAVLTGGEVFGGTVLLLLALLNFGLGKPA